jgi:hypothetical protein
MSAPAALDHEQALEGLAAALVALLARRWQDRQPKPELPPGREDAPVGKAGASRS